MLGCPHPVTVKRISALIHRWPRLVDLIFVDFLRAHDTWTSVLSPRSRRLWEDGRNGEKGGTDFTPCASSAQRPARRFLEDVRYGQ